MSHPIINQNMRFKQNYNLVSNPFNTVPSIHPKNCEYCFTSHLSPVDNLSFKNFGHWPLPTSIFGNQDAYMSIFPDAYLSLFCDTVRGWMGLGEYGLNSNSPIYHRSISYIPQGPHTEYHITNHMAHIISSTAQP